MSNFPLTNYKTGEKANRKQIMKLFPRAFGRFNIDEETVDAINYMGTVVGIPAEVIEPIFIKYIPFLKKAPISTVLGLVHAIQFCLLKEDMNLTDAYSKVFPERVARMEEEGIYVTRAASAFNRTTTLVKMIADDMTLQLHEKYPHHLDAAVEKQREIMDGKAKDHKGKDLNVSPHIQHLAAIELALLTKAPDVLKVEHSGSVEQTSVQDLMMEQLKAIAVAQREQLDNGVDIIDAQVIGLDFDSLEAEVARNE